LLRFAQLKRHEARATGAWSRGTIGVMNDAPHIRGAMRPLSAPRPAELDRAAAEIAGRQHGLLARRQLLELGFSPDMIKRRMARGSLHRVHAGVYAWGHRAITFEGRWMAAVLAFGPDAALSHRSAGQLWGLVPRSRIRPEVTRPRHAAGRSHLVVHQAMLPRDEVRRVRGIPVTSVPRTMLDLAATRTEREVERAWNEMEVRELTDRLSVPQLLDRHPRHRGATLLRRLADRKALPVGITRNDFEEAFLALVDRHGLPRPRMNAHLQMRGRFYEIDCFWEEQRVAIELDGAAAHKTTKAFDDDRERDRILAAEGLTTSRITWHHLHDTPLEVVRDLRLILTPYPLSDGP
jgi:very-short-patch-repair endonuclease